MHTSASLRARLKILLAIRKMEGDSLALVVGTNQIRRQGMAIDHPKVQKFPRTNFFNVSTILSKRLRALQ
jgi:hypothetical protein